jgi:hypothetical protein
MMIAPTPNPNRISEPCVSYGEICNEYIEICNYGESPVDTRGWWIADRGGHPGELIPWNEVNEGVLVGSAEIATSIIPAGRCALILPSIYANGDWPYNRMLSPAATILTLRNAAFIGDSLLGRGSDDARDVLVLYVGDESSIECVLSTYGSPEGALVGGNPEQIADPGSDAIPFNHPYGISGGPCRFDVASDDTASNWGYFTISDMSPGEMGGNCSPLP